MQIAKLKKFSTQKNLHCPLTQSIRVHRRALVLLPCFIPFHRCEKSARKSRNSHHLITQRDNIHVRTPNLCFDRAQVYDVRMAQFVLKIEKLSHIMGPRASQDLRSPSPIMAPGLALFLIDVTDSFTWH